MKWKIFFQLLLVVLIITIQGCKKDSATEPANSYSNKIELGAGLDQSNPFNLIGTATTFSGIPALIYFRLESADDMGGSAVSISVQKLSGSNYANYYSFEYPNPQSYGHIIVSAFSIQDKGNYKVSAYLVNGNKFVAAKEFTVQ